MSAWLPIRYRGYWDIPRIFLVRRENRLYLFDCPFSEALDDYPEEFTVYLLPDIPDADTPNDWTTLPARAVKTVGTVPTTAVRFDATRRAAIADDVFDAIRPPAPHLNGTNAHVQPENPVS